MNGERVATRRRSRGQPRVAERGAHRALARGGIIAGVQRGGLPEGGAAQIDRGGGRDGERARQLECGRPTVHRNVQAGERVALGVNVHAGGLGIEREPAAAVECRLRCDLEGGPGGGAGGVERESRLERSAVEREAAAGGARQLGAQELAEARQVERAEVGARVQVGARTAQLEREERLVAAQDEPPLVLRPFAVEPRPQRDPHGAEAADGREVGVPAPREGRAGTHRDVAAEEGRGAGGGSLGRRGEGGTVEREVERHVRALRSAVAPGGGGGVLGTGREGDGSVRERPGQATLHGRRGEGAVHLGAEPVGAPEELEREVEAPVDLGHGAAEGERPLHLQLAARGAPARPEVRGGHGGRLAQRPACGVNGGLHQGRAPGTREGPVAAHETRGAGQATAEVGLRQQGARAIRRHAGDGRVQARRQTAAVSLEGDGCVDGRVGRDRHGAAPGPALVGELAVEHGPYGGVGQQRGGRGALRAEGDARLRHPRVQSETVERGLEVAPGAVGAQLDVAGGHGPGGLGRVARSPRQVGVGTQGERARGGRQGRPRRRHRGRVGAAAEREVLRRAGEREVHTVAGQRAAQRQRRRAGGQGLVRRPDAGRVCARADRCRRQAQRGPTVVERQAQLRRQAGALGEVEARAPVAELEGHRALSQAAADAPVERGKLEPGRQRAGLERAAPRERTRGVDPDGAEGPTSASRSRAGSRLPRAVPSNGPRPTVAVAVRRAPSPCSSRLPLTGDRAVSVALPA